MEAIIKSYKFDMNYCTLMLIIKLWNALMYPILKFLTTNTQQLLLNGKYEMKIWISKFIKHVVCL